LVVKAKTILKGDSNMSGIRCWLIALAIGGSTFVNRTASAEVLLSPIKMKAALMDCSLEQASEIPIPYLSKLVESAEQCRQEFTDNERAHTAALNGLIELKNENFAEADRCLTESIDLDKSKHFVFWLRARCRSEMKNYELARNDCEECIAIRDDFVQVYLSLAGLSLQESDFDKAESFLEKARKLDDKTELACLNYLSAVHALKTNNMPQATQFADQALISHSRYMVPSPKSIWELKMRAAVKSRDDQEVKIYSKRLLASSPDDPKPMLALWKIYRDEGNELAALAIAEKLVAVDPDNEKYQLYRMASMADAKQNRVVEEIAQQIYEKNPDCKPALDVLEQIRVAKGNATKDQNLNRYLPRNR